MDKQTNGHSPYPRLQGNHPSTALSATPILHKGLEAMLSGDITLAKTILRDYVNATVGFSGLAEATHI
jgi:hypothetical protein